MSAGIAPLRIPNEGATPAGEGGLVGDFDFQREVLVILMVPETEP